MSQATLQWTTSDALAMKPLSITVLTLLTIIVEEAREQGSFVFLMVEPGYSTLPLQCYEMLNDLICDKSGNSANKRGGSKKYEKILIGKKKRIFNFLKHFLYHLLIFLH